MSNKNKNPEKKIDFRYNLSEYLRFLMRYKWVFILILFFILLLEAKTVVDKFLFKSIIDNGTMYAAGSLSKDAFTSTLLIVAIIFVLVVVSTFIIKWVYMHLINRLEGNLILDLKRKYFRHLLTLDHGFHVSHKTGSLISRLSRAGGAMERITDTIVFNFAPLIFQLIVVSLSIIYFDWLAGLIVFLTVFVFIIYSFILQRIQEPSNVEANTREDIEKGNIADIFTNIDSIKYFGKEKAIEKKFEGLTEDTRKAVVKNWDFSKYFDSGQTIIIGIGTFFLVYLPLMKFLNGEMTLGTLTFIYTTFLSLLGSVYGFVHGIRGYFRSMADFQDLFQYGKIEKEIKDNPGAKALKISKGQVIFEDVSFCYGKRKIFTDFNLKIPENKKVALVGHSGCGKTTLVKLLYRLYDVNKGHILIDGNDIKTFQQESLRSEMSIVPQEAVLFDDTIYNNIAFSNQEASKQEVMKAIRFAQLDKIIKQFPQKENTIVGERGVKLSGGEKQRVSIARAILANKKILVLDEATSALDSQTEHEIQEDLKKLMVGRTSIIIAHRLSTIMHADIIVVMKQGKIVQIGKHESLIKQQGEYRHLWNLQKGGYLKE